MVGVAVRMAQILGMQVEEELDDMPLARSRALAMEASYMGVSPIQNQSKEGQKKEDAVIEQEIRRRTFWSCFIMDRYLSSGKFRPQMFHIEDIRVQLPSSDRAFLFGEKVKTLLLGEETRGAMRRSDIQRRRETSVLLGTKSGRHVDLEGKEVTTVSGESSGRWEVGQDEGGVSRFIKALDLHGIILKWSCSGGRR
jgi:hypothetical protein